MTRAVDSLPVSQVSRLLPLPSFLTSSARTSTTLDRTPLIYYHLPAVRTAIRFWPTIVLRVLSESTPI